MARRSKHSKRHLRRSHSRRRHTYRRGGMAPLSYRLAGDWSSKMSMGQGTDYASYHQGQHGGYNESMNVNSNSNSNSIMNVNSNSNSNSIMNRSMSNNMQQGGMAPLSALSNSALPGHLRASAHLGGIDKALADVQGLRDQAGGRRKSHRRKNRRKSRRGGALGHAPFPSQGMLLSGSDYSKAGLNPHWRDVEVDAAIARQRL